MVVSIPCGKWQQGPPALRGAIISLLIVLLVSLSRDKLQFGSKLIRSAQLAGTALRGYTARACIGTAVPARTCVRRSPGGARGTCI